MRNERDVTIACSIRYYRMRNGMTLKQLAEKAWIEKFASKDISYEDKIEEFIDVFGRNYLD